MVNLKDLFLKNVSVRQTVFKNTSWLFIGEIAGRAIRFFIVIYAASVLGPANYGAFSYALTIAAFLTIFSDFGLSPVLTKETVKAKGNPQDFFGAAVALKFILIILNAVVLLAIIPLLSRVAAANALFPFVLFIFAFDSIRELGFGINRALERMEREAYVKIFLNIAVAGLGFYALSRAATAESLMWAYVIGTGLGLLATIFMLRAYLKNIFSNIKAALMWPLLKAAVPIGLLGILGALTINTDMIMLGWWRTTTEIGYYSAAEKIILLLYLVPTLIASAAFPVFSRLANVNNERFRLTFEKVMAVSTVLALPIAIGGVILAPDILALLFPKYLPATQALQILFITILILFPSAVIPNALFAYDKQKFFMIFTAVGVIGNILLNWLLIPQYGIIGCAIATVIAQLASNALIWWRMKRTNPFRLLPHIGRAVLATIILIPVIATLLVAGLPVLAIIAAAIVVYIGTLWLLNEPLLRELRAILRG